MITFIEGILEEKQPGRAVMNVQGIGYELPITLGTYDRLPSVGSTCRLLTYEHIREDAHILYGFHTPDEKGMFELLLGISGVGPKLAISALSGLTVRELKRAVVEGDIKRVSSVSGIGKKMAERIVVELKHKLSDTDALEAVAGVEEGAAGDPVFKDAALALTSLGYKMADAQKMVQKVMKASEGGLSVEELIRKALTG